MHPFILKPAIESDFEILKNIHHKTMKQHVSKIWGWDEEFQDKYYRENFHPQNIQLIYYGEDLTGYLQNWESEDKISLVNILILPDFQKNGLGTSIIQNLQNLATKKSKPLELGVFKINLDAKRLYEKLGFVVFEETKTHFLMRFQCNIHFERASLKNLSAISRIYPGDDSKYWIDFSWYWLEVCQRRADICGYLVAADENSLPIGFVVFGQHYSDRFLKNKIHGKAEIYHTVVDEDFQGRGLGKITTSLAIDILFSELSYSEILIAANPGNFAATNLYKGLGFSEVSKNYDDDPLFSLKKISSLIPISSIDLAPHKDSNVSAEKRNKWEQESLEYSESFNWENWENEIPNV